MTRPRRIQLSRARGFRLPAGCQSVARPTKWGNPFRVTGELSFDDRTCPDRQCAVACFRLLLAEAYGSASRELYPSWEEIHQELGGRDLACWCPLDQPCHADHLLEVANPRLAGPCFHPTRQCLGHEIYTTPDGQVCRACGGRESTAAADRRQRIARHLESLRRDMEAGRISLPVIVSPDPLPPQTQMGHAMRYAMVAQAQAQAQERQRRPPTPPRRWSPEELLELRWPPRRIAQA